MGLLNSQNFCKVIFGMPKSFLVAKTCFRRVRGEVISDQSNHLFCIQNLDNSETESARTENFGIFFFKRGEGHLFPKVNVRIVTKK